MRRPVPLAAAMTRSAVSARVPAHATGNAAQPAVSHQAWTPCKPSSGQNGRAPIPVRMDRSQINVAAEDNFGGAYGSV
jgi:hypothetical protein